jgi:ABC-2 type transport system permease protein
MTDRSSLLDVVRSEALKMRTTPVSWGFLTALVALTALNTSLSLADPVTNLSTNEGVRHVFTAGRDFAVLFVALGAVGAASEFRHNTAVPTFLATPMRHRVLIAKTLVHASFGTVIAVGMVGLQMAIALPWIASTAGAVSPWSAAVAEPAITTMFSAAAYAALGVALGTLVRNQLVALVVTAGWFAVAENALAAAAPGLSRFLPGGLFSGTDTTDLLAAPVAVALLAAYVLVLSSIAAKTTLRQDI